MRIQILVLLIGFIRLVVPDVLLGQSAEKLLLFLNGKPAGSETYSFTKSAGRIELKGQATLDVGSRQIAVSEFRLTMDESFKPLEAFMTTTIGPTAQEVKTVFAEGKAKGELKSGETKAPIEHAVRSDAFVMLPNVPFFAFEVLARRVSLATTEPQEFRAYILGQMELPLTAQYKGKETVEFANRRAELDHVVLTLSTPSLPLEFHTWTDEQRRLVKMTIPAQAFEIYRDGYEPKAEAPKNYDSIEITFPSDGIQIAGALNLPKKRSGRLAAVVLIAGSGAQDRDENVFGVKVFEQIAEELTANGLAVFRYDKRGIGKSGGDAAKATTYDFANDVRAALRFLRSRTEVDPNRIGLVGHSEGAAIAPLVAASDPALSTIVLMAGAAATGEKVILEQQEYLLKKMNLPDEEREKRVALQKRIFEAVKTGQGWEEIEKEMGPEGKAALQPARLPWFKEFIQLSPALALSQVRCPILILQGGKDTQIFPHYAEEMVKLLDEVGKAPHTMKLFPNLNHIFTKAETGDLSEYGRLSKQLDREFLDVLTAWLKEKLASTPSEAREDKARRADREQALMLLVQIAGDAGSLAEPKAAANIQSQVADLLWPFDERQARRLFEQAYENANRAISRRLERTDEKEDSPERTQALRDLRALRQEIVNLYAKHDRKAAEDMVATTPDDVFTQGDRTAPPDRSRATMLIAMARALVETNAEGAADLGWRSLAGGRVGVGFSSLLSQFARLGRKDLADGLTQAALATIQKSDPRDTENLTWLSFYILDRGGNVGRFSTSEQARMLLALVFRALEQAVEDLRQAALSGAPPPNLTRFYADCVQSYHPGFVKHDPNRAPQVQAMLSEMARAVSPKERERAGVSETLSGEEDYQAKLRRARQARDLQTRDALYRAAALARAMGVASERTSLEADPDRFREALETANEISNLDLRMETKDDIRSIEFEQRIGRKEYEEARLAALEVSASGLKALMLAEVARVFHERGKDSIRASELLNEALSVSLKADSTPDKVRALLVTLEVYARVDSTSAFRLLEAVAKTVNEVRLPPAKPAPEVAIAIAIGIGGQGLSPQQRVTLDNLVFGSGVEKLAREDFTRTVAIIEGVENRELKARLQLALCRGVLRR